MNNREQLTIETVISDENSILSPFSGKEPTISGEFADYLETSLPHSSKTENVKLLFQCETITPDEETMYERAIKNYYERELEKTNLDLKRNGSGSLITLILGAIFLSLVVMMTTLELSEVLTAIFDILAWIFVWEAMDLFFFRRREIAEKRKKCQAILSAEITFNK